MAKEPYLGTSKPEHFERTKGVVEIHYDLLHWNVELREIHSDLLRWNLETGQSLRESLRLHVPFPPIVFTVLFKVVNATHTAVHIRDAYTSMYIYIYKYSVYKTAVFESISKIRLI